MASMTELFTKDGARYYLIRVSRGRGQSKYSMRWYPQTTWSERTVQRELSKAAAEFERACNNGEIVTRAEKKQQEAEARAQAAKLRTVQQYADGVYMASKEASFSENARSSYRMFLDKYILPVVGDMLLKDVTPAMLTKLLLDFQKRGYAHASCVKLYNILNGIFQMAFMDDSIESNPMLKVRRPAPRKDEQAVDETEKAFTVAELNNVLACVEQEPVKWQVFIHLAADSACRRGELCALQWQDVDWQTGAVTIRRNLQYTPAKGVYETSPKNGKTRRVDVGEQTIALLRQLRQQQAETCMSKWVFTQEGSAEPIHPDSPTRYFKKFGKRYGIADFHPHKLRHTSASIAITNGADVASVSERLGHSDTAVTLRMYAHANEESIRRAGQTVRDALQAQNE